MRVAIVGGTGPFGRALAVRLREAGFEVVIGSRDADRAAALAEELGVEGAANAARGSRGRPRRARNERRRCVGHGSDSSQRHRRDARPVRRLGAPVHSRWRSPVTRADVARRAAPGELDGPVVAGLHSLAASTLGAEQPPPEDALVCGNDAGAKALALELAERITAGRALDAGPLQSARALEGLTAVIVNLNKRYKGHAGIEITGLP